MTIMRGKLADELGALKLALSAVPDERSQTAEFRAARTIVDALGDEVAATGVLDESQLEDAFARAAELASCAWRYVLEARMASAIAQKQRRTAQRMSAVAREQRTAAIAMRERVAERHARALRRAAYRELEEVHGRRPRRQR
jgi:hypothetical protein